MENKSFDNVSWLLDAVVSNFCMSIVDDFVRENADFQYNAGMSPKIVRTTDGKCCKWCDKLAGTYDYEKVRNTGNDVFRRHRNCGCIVAYDPGDGRIQNAHSKEWTTREEYDKLLQEKEHITPQQREDIARMKQEGGHARIPADVEGDFSDFPELTISEKERTAFSELFKNTQITRLEHGCVIQANGTIRFTDAGLPGKVKITISEDDGMGISIFHSHTNDTPFSGFDFIRFADKRVDAIGVVTNNGDVFVAYIRDGFRPPIGQEFEDIVAMLAKEADIAVMRDPRFYEWTYEEKSYMTIREKAFLIARYFGWEIQAGKL